MRVNSDPAAVGVTSATSPDRSMSWHRQLGETFDRTCTTNCVCVCVPSIRIYIYILRPIISCYCAVKDGSRQQQSAIHNKKKDAQSGDSY